MKVKLGDYSPFKFKLWSKLENKYIETTEQFEYGYIRYVLTDDGNILKINDAGHTVDVQFLHPIHYIIVFDIEEAELKFDIKDHMPEIMESWYGELKIGS